MIFEVINNNNEVMFEGSEEECIIFLEELNTTKIHYIRLVD